MEKKRLFVIDGHALCYRAYYALIRNPLINSEGQNVSAIFGFSRMLYYLVQAQKPDYLLIAFDPPGKSFRFDLYDEYKANRKKMPEDLKSQIEEIKKMSDVLGITTIIKDNYEADDVLGSISENFGKSDLEVVLVTGDKDAYQLVNENVKIYANKKGIAEYVFYDVSGIKEKTGLLPENIIDYMAIVGDTADNIPGIKGIGEKGALKLILEYGTLEKLYENVEDLKGKQKEYVQNSRDMAFLSRELVTIKRDLPIEIDFEKSGTSEMVSSEAREYFFNLDMDSIVNDYFPKGDEQSISVKPVIEKKYEIIRSEKELEKVIELIESHGELSIDTETTSVNPVEAELVGISLSINENEGWYIPLQSRSLFSEDYLDRDISLSMIKPVIENSDIKKIGQNIKYDFIVLKNADITMGGIYFDTMVASYLLNPNERRHNLDDLADKFLNYKTTTFKELVGIGKKAIPISEVPLADLADYAIEDADITLQLYNIFKEKLKEENLDSLFFDLEMKLVPVLAHVEINGVKIDKKHFALLGEENEALLKDLISSIYKNADGTFNINSTKELAHILFEKIGLKPVRKTKTGFSTDIKVLEALKGKHDIIEDLISYRTLNKLKNTYIDSLPKLILEKTGRIHTSYNQTVVSTGRLSSSDPNLQNIPVRGEFGRKIRKGFVPEKGFELMAADYSQIELRLAAHLSGDKAMINAFKENIDIHSLTASSVFSCAIEDVDSDMRRKAKIINFATIYGVSPFGLSQQAEIGFKEAAEFIKIYFETYPGFKDYVDKTIAFAGENGYVETLMGRKRMIPEINSDTSFRREGAERTAINTPIQGTSADMIKLAMINIFHEFEKRSFKSKMIMQVHDELVFEIYKDEKEEIESLVKEMMENVFSLDVPIVVEIGSGKNWDEAH